MNNLSSYFGLVDEKIRASDKDLPVIFNIIIFKLKIVWKPLWKSVNNRANDKYSVTRKE